MAKITIDSHIRVPELSQEWIEGLAKLCSFKNEEKETALNEHIWGAGNMDDLITLADYQNETLILPRGFLPKFKELMSNNVEYIDNTIDAPSTVKIPRPPSLRKYQSEAVREALRGSQGRLIAPPGKGKTVMGLGLIAEVKKPTLVLVSQKHIAKQWSDRAKQHIGRDLGFIGDQKWDEQDITVALIQTLWSRKEKLDGDKWWDKWSIVILDEQHHVPAETFYQIVSKFRAKYRLGLSATVGKSDAKKKFSELIFGPILYEVKETAVKPDIKVINTPFEFDFHPTQRVGNRTIRNNYHNLIQKLVDNEPRNAIIAKFVAENIDHANLIFSRRLAHLDSIREYTIEFGFPEDRCWMLTGAECLEERMEIYERADEGNCAIFSTIADEALDIPRLDRGYLAFPVKNEEIIKQQLGRVSREHENKKDAIVYDFVDKEVPVLKKQYGNRLRKHYQRNKLNVEIESY